MSAYHVHYIIYSLQQSLKIGASIIPRRQMRKLRLRDTVDLILIHTVAVELGYNVSPMGSRTVVVTFQSGSGLILQLCDLLIHWSIRD